MKTGDGKENFHWNKLSTEEDTSVQIVNIRKKHKPKQKRYGKSTRISDRRMCSNQSHPGLGGGSINYEYVL